MNIPYVFCAGQNWSMAIFDLRGKCSNRFGSHTEIVLYQMVEALFGRLVSVMAQQP